jgi:hypothetical protein
MATNGYVHIHNLFSQKWHISDLLAIYLSPDTEFLTNRTSFPSGMPPLDPSIPPDYLENGRWYHGYRKGIYMLPCDEVLIPHPLTQLWRFRANMMINCRMRRIAWTSSINSSKSLATTFYIAHLSHRIMMGHEY